MIGWNGWLRMQTSQHVSIFCFRLFIRNSFLECGTFCFSADVHVDTGYSGEIFLPQGKIKQLCLAPIARLRPEKRKVQGLY